MTRKLTDEQVKAIKKGENVRIPYLKAPNAEGYLNILVSKISKPSRGTKPYWLVRTFDNLGDFSTAKEAITFIEHLLNQRYQWLLQNNGWIMSGEVYKFKDAGKVLELMNLAGISGLKNPWYKIVGEGCPPKSFSGYPSPDSYLEGITIDKDSPIWDAVKGVEAQEYTPKKGVNQ
jgi:hypothetical protein